MFEMFFKVRLLVTLVFSSKSLWV